MQSIFAFEGKIRPLPYALWSIAVFFSQHLVVRAMSAASTLSPNTDWWFYLVPLRWAVAHHRASDVILITALAYGLVAAWVLAALAFRRAADANINGSVAAFAIVPIVQIAVILFLCCLPSRVAARSPVADNVGAPSLAWAAAQGVVAGVAATLLAVAISTLVFRVYGFGLFVASPFVIGAMTAYFANRKQDIGGAQTALLVLGATGLGGLGLIVVPLEGLVCIIMASPLAVLAALVGGALGRAVAVARRSAKETLASLALLPLVFAAENVLETATRFDTDQTIEIHAPPEAVWRSIVHMESIEEAPALPFRLGVAYPLRGEVIGEGVGALRRGEFSTGTAIERVTEWIPNQKLAFVVSKDVPAMRELSPYQHVHAPHVVGYFRTTYTSFELLRRSDGHTQVVERTSHELRLEPVLYWLPMARWVVNENNARVLAQIRRQAERSVQAGN